MTPETIAKKAASFKAFERGFKEEKDAYIKGHITLKEFIMAHKEYFKELKNQLK